MVKFVTRICNLLSVIMVLAVVAVGSAMIVPRIMGNDIYAVMSGSMEPYYHVGSLVIVDKHVSPEEISVGDPITFRMNSGAVATHRVVSIDEEAREFTTKGDANEVQDMAPVPFDNMIGKAGAIDSSHWLYPALYENTKGNVQYRSICHCIYTASDHTGDC